MEAVMAAMKSEIQEAFKSEAFQQLLQTAIHDALGTAISKIIEPITQTITQLQERFDDLESQLLRVANMANDNEQYSRRHNIRVSGFDEERGENCVEKVAQFCNYKLHINITEENIDRAHRMGKSSVNKSQAIIVRFKSHSDKIAVLSKRREL
jgi:Zn-dependent M32 family carboxypeptidase